MLLRDNIYEAIRNAILTCEYSPGQSLREQVLAERYRVSRSPVRDSLLRLEQENLVTVLPRQGYRVNPISESDVEDILGLRLLVEPACAAGAARVDNAALRALDQFRGFHHEEQAGPGFFEHNRLFHRAITDLCGNARMSAMARSLDEQFQRLARFAIPVSTYRDDRDASGEHEAIIDAVQDHDAERAARLAYEHSVRAHTQIQIALRVKGRWAEPMQPPAYMTPVTAIDSSISLIGRSP